jgi:hypothetical protein
VEGSKVAEYHEIAAGDGQTWRLRFNNRALRWFEQETGIKFTNINESDLGLTEITYLVAAGMYGYHGQPVTVEDADEFVDTLGLQRAMESAMTALQDDLKIDLEDTEQASQNGATAKKKNSTGKSQKQRQRA